MSCFLSDLARKSRWLIYQPPYVLTESVRSSKIVIYVWLRSRRTVRSVSDVTPRLRTLVKKNPILIVTLNIIYYIKWKHFPRDPLNASLLTWRSVTVRFVRVSSRLGITLAVPNQKPDSSNFFLWINNY